MSFLNTIRAPFLAAALAIASLSVAPTDVLAQAASAAEAAAPAAASAAAEPVAAPPVGVVTPEVKKEEIENPYGLKAMVQHAGLFSVTTITLAIMIIMSVGSWYIIIVRLWEQSKLYKSAREAGGFWSAGTVKKGAESLAERSAFRYVAEEGMKAAEHHEGTLVEQIDRHTWIGMSVQRAVDTINSSQQTGLAFLATVGSTAPFVGLFGTVWGILQALTQIGVSGQASIDKVAGPVGEALIMTAIGLAVAVPAVIGYNWLIRRNKLAMEQVRTFAGDLHNVLLAGKK